MLRSPRRTDRKTPATLQPLESRRLLANLVWTGDVDSFWGTSNNGNTNWSGDVLPQDGDILTFAPALNKISNNNMAGLNLKQIFFTEGGYIVGGNAVSISTSISDNTFTGGNLCNLAIFAGQATIIRVTEPNVRLTLGGVISGTATITKTGDGIVRLAGAGSNTASGTFNVEQGTLELGKTGGATAIAGALGIGDGLGADNSTRVVLVGHNQISNSAAVNVYADGQLALGNFSDATGPITLVGGEANVGTGVLTTSSVTVSQFANSVSVIAGSTGKLNVTTGSFLVHNATPAIDLNVLVAVDGAAGLFKAGAGRMNIGVVPAYTGSTFIDAGTLSASVDLGANGHVMNVNVAANGTLELSASQTFNSLNNIGNVNVLANGSRVLRAGSLSMSAAGRLDLADNAMIIDYAGASPASAINGYLSSGYAGGAWTGNGIRSSTAAGVAGRAIGMGEATSLYGAFPATFSSQPVDNTSIVLKYTAAGDANFDGSVDFGDLLVVAQNYGLTGRSHAQGNLNYSADGKVDFDDLLLLAQRYGTSLANTTDAKSTARHRTCELLSE